MPEDLQTFEYQRTWTVDAADPEKAFPSLNYLKDWRSHSDFITYQPTEEIVRADMQELFTEIQEYLNRTFRDYVVASGNSENARIVNEEARIANELQRVANENARLSNEATRQAQEQAREIAEQNRANENSGIVAQATAQASAAASSAQSASESAAAAANSAASAASSAAEAAASEQRVDADAAVVAQAAGMAAAAADDAAAARGAAQDAAVTAQSYAKGGTGSRTGENTDNAKYYKEQSAALYDAVDRRFQTGLDNGLLCAKNINLTLTAAGWSESEPYVQTVSVGADALIADQAGHAFLSPGATDAQYAEACRCIIRLQGATTSTVTFRAAAAKPTVDLPVTLELHFTPEALSASYATQADIEALTAADVGAIPTTEKGAQNGVATLGSDGKIPSAQLPSMSFIPTSAKGAANGVATLDGNGKVPTAQIPALDYVPKTRKLNGKELSADVTLSAADVGARADTWKPAASDLPTVPISKGGTGATTVAAARAALHLGNTDGPLPLTAGGTGANNLAEAKEALGIPAFPLSLENGGTGATSAADARVNLGIPADLSNLLKLRTASGVLLTKVENDSPFMSRGSASLRVNGAFSLSVPNDALVFLDFRGSVDIEREYNGGSYSTTYDYRAHVFVDMTTKTVISADPDNQGRSLVTVGEGILGILDAKLLLSESWNSAANGGYTMFSNNTPLTYVAKWITTE